MSSLILSPWLSSRITGISSELGFHVPQAPMQVWGIIAQVDYFYAQFLAFPSSYLFHLDENS